MKNAILDCKPEYNVQPLITHDREWGPANNDQDLGCLRALSGGPGEKKNLTDESRDSRIRGTTCVVKGSTWDETQCVQHFPFNITALYVVKNKGRIKLNIELWCLVNVSPYLSQHLQVVKQNAFLISCTSYRTSPHPHPTKEFVSHTADTTILRKWPMDQWNWKIAPVG